MTSWVHAACTPAADATPSPVAGTTVTCSGATTDQNAAGRGYGTGNQTGITIDVQNAASVTGTTLGLNVLDATVRNGVGAIITGGLNGFNSDAGFATVTNSGSIIGTTGSGIRTQTGLTLLNNATGSITAGVNGIFVFSGAADVTNLGSITGIGVGFFNGSGTAKVSNSGRIEATSAGASSIAVRVGSDVTVVNEASGVIKGGHYGIASIGGSATVTNSGNIDGTTGYGVWASRRASVINEATGIIHGDINGILAIQEVADVVNAGRITALSGSGVYGDTGVAVTNLVGGVISSSGNIGVFANSGTATVTNSGSIVGGGNSGVRSLGDVVVVNNAGGTISGATYGVSSLGVTRVTNSGTIAGASIGGVRGGTFVTVLNNAGGVISGGDFGVVSLSGAAEVTNSGRITAGTGSAIFARTDATVVNNAGATIDGRDDGINGFTGSVNLVNSGSIIGRGDDGVSAQTFATVVNKAGGSIVGNLHGIYNFGGGSSVWNAGTISGSMAAITFSGSGNTLTLAPGSVISGNVVGAGSDTLQFGGTGSASFDVSQIGPAAQYQGFGTLNKIDTSLWSLTGTATYAGPVNVNGGTLAVNGNLASASLLTVNSDGTLGGAGVVGSVAINGGTLAPGNSIGTLTIGSLTMTAASTYLVQISGATSDKTVVTATAAIAGKVNVDPLKHIGSTTTYTILNAGTLAGTFSSASVINNFARNARLSYVGNDVLLTVDAGLLSPILPAGAAVNQKNVAAGVDNAILSGATLPASFNALFTLSGNDLLNALKQVSGETATGAQQTTFDAMTQFMGVISDPFTAGRNGGAPAASAFADEGDALAYTQDGRKRTRAERDAFALFTKAPPRVYEARWNVWAAGFGGSRTTDANALVGAGRTNSSIGGAAIGADYWFSPATVAGFALAGGGTSFSVAGGGSGRSDLFQAGAFVRHDIASSYITATVAYGWQDISTDRLVTGAGTDRLRASFSANAYSGRIEGGNRWLLPQFGGIGVSPYAAVQVTAFDLPAYAETSLNGAGGLALTYAARTVTAPRTELGLRSDKSWAMAEGLLTLRGRAAWAHDYNSDRNVSAVFQSLPGSAFIVNGAQPGRNAALASASAEMNFNGGWSVVATFDGEFSDVSTSYAGKGVVRYAW